ncbi:MAG: SMI1/KNR4 family protein [Lachnoclostridium sp.]|nr:SMI1/KNR4 family protein [Lachnospira sp.]MCM1248294.1 SMI1/KNR4 family protein [Lachnoclostridium sp.]
MNIFEKMSKTLTRADIAEIEENLGLVFPEYFVEHYLSYNGGIPTKSFFYSEEESLKVNFQTETEVQVFLPLKYPYSDILIGTAEEKYLLFKGKSPLMTSYFPFANDYGANPICINLEDGGVYIVYMDLGELDGNCFRCLAESFQDFVEGLSEDSIDD